MAKPVADWAAGMPIQPDILIPDLWRNEAALQRKVDEWIQSLSHFQ
jgi:hypothetical protein